MHHNSCEWFMYLSQELHGTQWAVLTSKNFLTAHLFPSEAILQHRLHLFFFQPV